MNLRVLRPLCLVLLSAALARAQGVPGSGNTQFNNSAESSGGVVSGTDGNALQGAPSVSSRISLRAGQVDAVTGDLLISLPLGPRLPGRIPIGFTWNFNTSAGAEEYGSALYPIAWPSPEMPYPQVTMWFNGIKFQFLKKAAPTGGLPSVQKVTGWLRKRKVSESVLTQLAAGAIVYASDDGKRFLVVSNAEPRAMAVVNGDQAIWTSNILGDTRISHVTNLWGDHVSITEENFNLAYFFPSINKIQYAPRTVTIVNTLFAGHSITLALTSYGYAGCPSNFTISNSMGLPVVSALGYLWAMQRTYLEPNGTTTTVHGEVIETYTKKELPVASHLFLPTSIIFTATNNETQSISINWLKQTEQVTRGAYPCAIHTSGDKFDSLEYCLPRLDSISYQDGLIESFKYSGMLSLAGNAFDPIDGHWKGWGPTSYDGVVGAVRQVAFTGANVDQSVWIARTWPVATWVGNTRSWPQPKHETAVLYFPTATPDSGTSFRGVHFIHPDGGSWVDATDKQAYLFSTSAILKAESVYGTGIPLEVPFNGKLNYEVPSLFSVYDTTLNENWELRSWGNPSGNLTGTDGLPVNARQTKISKFPIGLPAQISVTSEWDDFGPTRTDSYHYDAIQAPPLSGSTLASWGTATVAAAPIHKKAKLSRHLDDSLGLLLSDSESSTLDGSRLPALRSGATVIDLGVHTIGSYDEFGRSVSVTDSIGAFSSTELRFYETALPLVNEVQKSLRDGTVNYLANPDDTSVKVGHLATYDSTPFHWPNSQTDKVDGRPASILIRDNLGRPTKTKAADGTIVSIEYDTWGRIKSSKKEARPAPDGINGAVDEVLINYEYDVSARFQNERPGISWTVG